MAAAPAAHCIDCGAPIDPYLYAGEVRWKHGDDMPHRHAATPERWT